MKKKLTANLGLKILAVLFSVVIWFIVININDPVDKTIFRNVPVEILHADAVMEQGKVYEVLDGTDMIDVTVWAKRSILDTLSKDNIIATADMQEINFMDTMVRIKLSTNKYNDRLESIQSSTESMMVSIEDLKRKQFVISTVAAGEPADGYILGNISSDQNLLDVSGPESVVSRIDRAEVSVDVANLSQDIRTNATIRLYDADNALVEDAALKKSLEQVRVNIEILQTKRVPISAVSTGTPAQGFAVTGVIEENPSTVLIAGKAGVLKNVSQIEIPDGVLNVTGLSGNMTMVLDIRKYLPEGVSLAESDFSGDVRFIVYIEEETVKEIEIDPSAVSINGVPEGLEAEILAEDTVAVWIAGLDENVEELDVSAVAASADLEAYRNDNALEELSPGEYMVPVELQLPEGIRQPQQALVRIELRDKEESSED